MKKNLLLGICLLGSVLASNAQVVWIDNFDDEDISDWTLTDSDGDGLNWGDSFVVTDQNEDPITPVSLISRSWQGTALTPDNWIVSPVINLSEFNDAVTLTWTQQVSEDFFGEHYSVYVGTTNDIATLVNSEVSFTLTPTEGGITTKSLDLSSFAGETAVYVAFRHYNVTDMDYLSIDDVTVTAGDVAGLNNNLASKFSVYPNPANNIVNINAANNIAVNNVSVVDMNGRTVKNIDFTATNEHQINISDLSSGVYMMNISSELGKTTKKIIKN